MSEDVPEQFCPRLCHVVKWPDFQGYGFNLHAEKGKAGQFIGKVDDDSPSEAAHLKEGDRIVEVNGVNIGNENHQQVVNRVRSGGDETRLLVVDTDADNWYKEHKRVIRGDLPEVKCFSAARNGDSQQEPTEPEPEPAEIEQVHQTETIQEVVPDPEPEPEPEIVAAPVVVPAQEPVNGINGSDAHRPRYCHLRLWPDFQGYGFNLHAERDKPGQYIGLVDDNSPSSTGGLKVNDRIVEVNGVNVEAETHSDVISRIKAVPGETRLLVVDRETDAYYRDRGITVSSSMPQTECIYTPETSAESVNGLKSQEPEPEPDLTEYTIVTKEPARPEPTPAPVESKPDPSPAPTAGAMGNDGLELNLSVAEMKERIKAKKRQDPRLSKISFEQKYKEFQRM